MRTRLFLLVCLLSLLALPTMSYAQVMDPEAVVHALNAAENAQDVEASLALFAEDAVYDLIPPPPGQSYPLVGIAAIRERREEIAEANASVTYEIVEVDGNTVISLEQYTDDDLLDRGIDYLEATVEYVVEDGKIQSLTWTATDESMAKLGIPVDAGSAEAAAPQTQMAAQVDRSDPEAIYRAAYDAFNDGDTDRAMTYFADDIVALLFPPPPGGDITVTGKEPFRQSMAGAVAINMQWQLSDFHIIDDETASYTVSLEADDFMADLGVYPLEFTGFIVIRDGLIQSEVWSMTASSRNKLDRVLALEANKALATRFMEELWNEGNVALADELLSDDFVSHAFPQGDREALKDAITGFHTDFPEGYFVVDEMTVTEDKIVMRGGMIPQPPAADEEPERADTWIVVLSVADGQITERWVAFVPQAEAAEDESAESETGTPATVTLEAELDEMTAAKIETIIEDAMQAYQIPGCAISVIKDGQPAYVRGFGVAELSSDRPVTSQSLFHMASVSKTATAIGIMQLAAQGKIDLDAPVTDYLPYFALEEDLAQTITIRQLLSHTAGVPDVVDWMADFGSPSFDEEALEREVRSLSNRSLLFDPGEGWDYSSDGFNVLGDVIAKVSGQSYESYIRENIFTPLGMTQTTQLVEEAAPDLLTAPHIADETEQIGVNPVFPYSRLHGPSNNLYSNAEDMARLAMAHLNRGEFDGVRILPAAMYEEMWAPVSETWFPPEFQRQYGLGWMIGDHGGYKVVSHGGLDFGYNANFVLVPEEGAAFTLACNRAEFGAEIVAPAFEITESILDALLATN